MSKSSILAIGIVAILMMCALSGAVIIANNGSDNGNSDVDKNTDVRSMTSNITKNTTSVRDYQTKTASSEEKVMPLLPETSENFTTILSEVAEDTILSDFLNGRAFQMADTVYTIDSDTAALGYLYTLGFMSIGDCFVIDTYGVNMTEIEETNVDKIESDENLLVTSNMVEKDVEGAALADAVRRSASTKVLLEDMNINDEIRIQERMLLRFADLSVAEFLDSNILMKPVSTIASEEIVESTDLLMVNTVLEENVDVEKNKTVFCDTIDCLKDTKVMDGMQMDKTRMFRDCMIDALCCYINENVNDEETYFEGNILDILTGSVFTINGVPMVVEDAQTLALYLYANFEFQIVGTSIVTMNYLPMEMLNEKCFTLVYANKVCAENRMFDMFTNYDMYRNCSFMFFDVADVSPFVFTDIVDLERALTVHEAQMMGNAYASCVLSSFIKYGTMSNETVYKIRGILCEKIEDVEEDVEVDEYKDDEILEQRANVVCSTVQLEKKGIAKETYDTVLDVLVDTPFFYHGEFMVIEDLETLCLFLSEQYLVITNDDMISFSYFSCGEYEGINSLPIEDMPAIIFADLVENDYINTDGYGSRNVFDGGYLNNGMMQYELQADCLEGVAYGIAQAAC